MMMLLIQKRRERIFPQPDLLMGKSAGGISRAEISDAESDSPGVHGAAEFLEHGEN
jgi:hypothetical protein